MRNWKKDGFSVFYSFIIIFVVYGRASFNTLIIRDILISERYLATFYAIIMRIKETTLVVFGFYIYIDEKLDAKSRISLIPRARYSIPEHKRFFKAYKDADYENFAEKLHKIIPRRKVSSNTIARAIYRALPPAEKSWICWFLWKYFLFFPVPAQTIWIAKHRCYYLNRRNFDIGR